VSQSVQMSATQSGPKSAIVSGAQSAIVSAVPQLAAVALAVLAVVSGILSEMPSGRVSEMPWDTPWAKALLALATVSLVRMMDKVLDSASVALVEKSSMLVALLVDKFGILAVLVELLVDRLGMFVGPVAGGRECLCGSRLSERGRSPQNAWIQAPGPRVPPS
jgi:phage-related holin